jgi:threonine synthase
LKYFSTKNKEKSFTWSQAVLQGLPEDNGLFMPENFSRLPDEFFNRLNQLTVAEIGFEISRQFTGNDIQDNDLKKICEDAFNFPVPVIELESKTYVTELFHGPTLAFKDFGARFMARTMSFLNKGNDKKLTILVATSGDTGSAVADGFFNVEGIEVFILYPSGKVSPLQEKQLTTYGNNIHALEIDGNFDDCQKLVKTAFLDYDISNKYRLSSANSINIARLIPQMVYYFSSYSKFSGEKNICMIVPSGNFGNLTAGLFAKRLGLPVKHFIAATNINDSVPLFLSGKGFNPKESFATISNAMDVGNPSNFYRLAQLFGDSYQEASGEISSYVITDGETEEMMREVFKKYSYIADPHGAVGIAAWKKYSQNHTGDKGIILETAHPAKFIETVEKILNIKVEIPQSLKMTAHKDKCATKLSSDFTSFKRYILSLK